MQASCNFLSLALHKMGSEVFVLALSIRLRYSNCVVLLSLQLAMRLQSCFGMLQGSQEIDSEL